MFAFPINENSSITGLHRRCWQAGSQPVQGAAAPAGGRQHEGKAVRELLQSPVELRHSGGAGRLHAVSADVGDTTDGREVSPAEEPVRIRGGGEISTRCQQVGYFYVVGLLCRLKSIAAHRDNFIQPLSVCLVW